LLLTVVSAIAFGLAFPPTSWALLAWFALAPFFVTLRRGSLAQALLMTWIWCLVAAYVVGDWFPGSVTAYFEQPMPVAIALFVAIFTTMAGPYYMAFTLAYRVLARRFLWLLPFLTAAAWVTAELGRGRLFTGSVFFIGNPWGLIGYSHVDLLPFVQIGAITGIYGVSFAVVCVNAALAELWFATREGAVSPRTAVAVLGLSVLPAFGVLAYGWGSLATAEAEDSSTPVTPIAIVQGHMGIGSSWRPEYYGKSLEVYLGLTREATRQGDPEIVFWPESAMSFFLETEPGYRHALARAMTQDHFELVIGGPRAVPAPGGGEPLYYNSVFSLGESGDIQGRYDKEYLVPFGEYFPLNIDVMRRKFGRVRYFTHGTTTGPLPTRAGLAGIAVCNETMLPEVISERVARGAAYLVNPSNDTWISDDKYVQQQFDMAIIRAIEQRRYLVRASTAGPSAVIDPWGRVLARVEPLTRGFVLGAIRPMNERSVYGRVGDLFAFLCLAAAAAGVAVARRHATSVARSQR
jgi:apolipoprotein N-acyltransferase